MDKNTQDLIQIVSSVLFLISIFAAAFWGARWSRKKNLALNQHKKSSCERAEREAIKQGKNPYSSSEFWAGNVVPWKEAVGRFFAVIAIVLFLAFLMFCIFVVIPSI